MWMPVARNIARRMCGDAEASWPDAGAATRHLDVLWQSLMVVAGVAGRVAGALGRRGEAGAWKATTSYHTIV